MKKKCLLSTHNLTKEYKNKKAVNSLNITVYEGDVYGFLGPNGAGKSTTIKSIMGLIKPTSGKVIINGYDVEKDSEKAIEKIGTMVEAPSFYGGLSGYKNLILMANLYGVPKKRVDEVLEMVRLTDSAHKNVSKYSLGMKQRLGIARAFLNNPNIVILDEPTNGLDPQGIKDIRELIQDLSKKYHVTFLISSHILSEIQAVCNRIGIIEKGSLKVEGYVEELLNTDEEVIEIYTREKEKTSRLLKNMNTFSKIECFEGGIRIKIKKGNFRNINKLLISNDVNVENLHCSETSLEDYFFDVMEGDKKYA
ncbi:ABC transporter ATP-binding protein [Clostridium botulinum]|uniref:ABC transporter ATP-binding protein n=1 Tax=Clostridium botulinum TaxID=1491 RepID=UPI0007E092C4|nr:ABC transporter ATP-binding protein [Clostridium botulinum]KEJ02299.1 bacitracin ABC transporter ATP-binding protein [Clostridium botulinum F 357]MBE1305229.1 ABC transporter ATP-binding protein [Clostridium botulinum]